MKKTKSNYRSGQAAVKAYKSDIEAAYSLGYSRGWDDAYKIPKRLGAKTAAVHGYSQGINYHRKSDKFIDKYRR